MNFRKLIFLSILFIYACPSHAQQHYKLISIDTSAMFDYYTFFFRSKTKDIIVLSERKYIQKEGCWERIKEGKIYNLSLSVLENLKSSNGINISLRGNGFTNLKNVFLKPGEHFFQAEEINGLFVLKEAILIHGKID